jgi:hypothetical protein
LAEIEYPKEFIQCPLCGCPDRVIEMEVEQEKAKGKIGPDRLAAADLKMCPIVDVTRSYLQAPVLIIYSDICAKCGYEYVHVITRQEMPREQIEDIMGISPLKR